MINRIVKKYFCAIPHNLPCPSLLYNIEAISPKARQPVEDIDKVPPFARYVKERHDKKPDRWHGPTI